jgi:hypothetical protein
LKFEVCAIIFVACSVAWFKKKHSQDVVEALMTPLIKLPKDKDKYPPTFKISLPMRDGRPMFDTYDHSKQEVDFAGIDFKGAEVVVIMRCNGVWLAGGKYGCTFRAEQIKVYPSIKVCLSRLVADDESEY